MTDPAAEIPAFNQIIAAYSLISRITPSEFFEARICLASGLLKDKKGEAMIPYKTIDLEAFLQVEAAYIDYRNECAEFEAGFKMIDKFLNPEPPELTEEEIAQKNAANIELVKKRIEEDGEFKAAFIVYDYLKDLPDFQPFRNEADQIKKMLMPKFIAREKKLHIFYNKLELGALEYKFENGLKYKMPGLIYQEVKNIIVENYIKSLK